MKKGILIFAGVIALMIIAVLSGAIYTVHETEQVVITKFGDPIGEPITDAGLKFKVPFIQVANRFENRILEWDGKAIEMPTKDKTYIKVDTYGRWRISNALQFFQRLTDERSARSRLDDIIGSATLSAIANHELIEAIRTTKDRVPAQPEEIVLADPGGRVGKMPPIKRGRRELEHEILETSREKLREFGIELLDVRFKRINYNESVRTQIYERMISERQQIASRFRSEGEGEAAKIEGDKEKDLKEIESGAYKQVQIIQGEADAKATQIYAEAYNQSPDSVEFYEFLRTMELYPEMLGGDSTLILSTDSDLFQFLKKVEGQSGSKSKAISPPGLP